MRRYSSCRANRVVEVRKKRWVEAQQCKHWGEIDGLYPAECIASNILRIVGVSYCFAERVGSRTRRCGHCGGWRSRATSAFGRLDWRSNESAGIGRPAARRGAPGQVDHDLGHIPVGAISGHCSGFNRSRIRVRTCGGWFAYRRRLVVRVDRRLPSLSPVSARIFRP